jgi:hypothetical protein
MLPPRASRAPAGVGIVGLRRPFSIDGSGPRFRYRRGAKNLARGPAVALPAVRQHYAFPGGTGHFSRAATICEDPKCEQE